MNKQQIADRLRLLMAELQNLINEILRELWDD